MLIQQGTSSTPLLFLMVDSSDHLTAKTGLSPSVTLSKCGGGFSAPAGAVTEIGSGWYKVAGNAADTNTLGPLILHATATGADPVDSLWEVVAVNVQDAAALGLSRLDAAVTSRLASASYTAPDNAGVTAIKAKTDNLPASPAAVGSAMALTAAYDAAKTALSAAAYTTPPTAADIATAVWAAGTRTLSSFGSLVADAAAAVWAADTRTLSNFGTLATDAATAVWAASTRTLSSFGNLVSDTTAAVWSALTSGLSTSGSIGKLLVDDIDAKVSSATAPTATAVATQVDSTLSASHGSGLWGGATGTGDAACTIGVYDANGDGMPGVELTARAASNVDTDPIVAQGTTGDDGSATLYLETGQYYYIWRRKAGYSWSPNPIRYPTEGVIT